MRSVLSILLVLGLASGAGTAQEDISAEHRELFDEDILPILEENCFKCHGGEEEIEGGLILTSRRGVLRGGHQGPAIALDALNSSLLLEMISYKDEDHEMPPTGKLQSWDADALIEWVQAGAPWPGEMLDDPSEDVPLLHGMKRSDPELWAFRRLRRPTVPTVDASEWNQNPIDAFVYARIENVGLTPAPELSKSALIRRVTYDLTGLPPSPEDAAAFVADESPNAYEHLIDTLLASPRYGEQWGRHWLDLVRYADSNGYERDSDKPYIWRYRDYVIDAFNQDKPYDEFIREQLAGDELDDPDADDIIATGYYRLGLWDDEPADPLLSRYDNLDDIANTTSQVFLGMTMGCARCHDHKLDPIPQADYYRFLAFFQGIKAMNRTKDNGILRSILSPAEQSVYDERVRENGLKVAELREASREILASFQKTILRKRPNLVEDESLLLSDLANLRYRFYRDTWETLPDFDQTKPEDTGRIDHDFITTAPASRTQAIGFVFEGKLRVPADDEYTFYIEARDGVRLIVADSDVYRAEGLGHHEDTVAVRLTKGTKPFRLEYFTKDGPPSLRVAWSSPGMKRRSLSVETEQSAKTTSLTKLFDVHGRKIMGDKIVDEYRRLLKERREVEAQEIEGKWAAAVSEEGPEPIPTHILIRGNPHAEGKVVQAGFPMIIGDSDPPKISEYQDESTSGRRRVLAEWIASPSNPLTARVMVNRIWQFHFGRGIVRSSNNFGAIGDRPTHPELLDWLASEFVSREWSMKALHKLILRSRTYRMASTANPKALAQDPENNLFWRFDMRRLSAEEIRDSLLAASGTLNRDMRGPGVYPKLPPEVIATSSKQQDIEESGMWGSSSPEEAARRSIYIHVKRSLLMPILTDFDLAETDASCPVRFSTTQPTQALGMLNSVFVNEQAALLGDRVRREAGSDVASQVRRALAIATSRVPTDTELAQGQAFIREAVELDGLDPDAALDRFCLLAFNLNEFMYLD